MVDPTAKARPGEGRPDCPHLERREGLCLACGHCEHDVILNGVCFACGRPFQPGERPGPRPDLVPAQRLRRK